VAENRQFSPLIDLNFYRASHPDKRRTRQRSTPQTPANIRHSRRTRFLALCQLRLLFIQQPRCQSSLHRQPKSSITAPRNPRHRRRTQLFPRLQIRPATQPLPFRRSHQPHHRLEPDSIKRHPNRQNSTPLSRPKYRYTPHSNIRCRHDNRQNRHSIQSQPRSAAKRRPRSRRSRSSAPHSHLFIPQPIRHLRHRTHRLSRSNSRQPIRNRWRHHRANRSQQNFSRQKCGRERHQSALHPTNQCRQLDSHPSRVSTGTPPPVGESRPLCHDKRLPISPKRTPFPHQF
jgi:hypothetical protein